MSLQKEAEHQVLCHNVSPLDVLQKKGLEKKET